MIRVLVLGFALVAGVSPVVASDARDAQFGGAMWQDGRDAGSFGGSLFEASPDAGAGLGGGYEAPSYGVPHHSQDDGE